MKCSRCSAEIPAQSQFCLRCGTPVRGNAPTMTAPARPNAPVASMAAPKSNRNPMLAVVALLVLAVLGLGAMVLVQKAGKSDPGKLVAAPANADNGGLVQKPAEASPGATVQKPAEANPNAVVQKPDAAEPFPADIDDYLKFLKRIEEEKKTLSRSETKDALLMLGDAKALSASIEEKDYSDAFKKMAALKVKATQDWRALTQEFNSKQPPSSCIDLRNKYLNALSKTQGVIYSALDATSQVQSNPSEALNILTQMQGKASAEVDAANDVADDALTDVCDKYRLRKDFKIASESGSGGGLLR